MLSTTIARRVCRRESRSTAATAPESLRLQLWFRMANRFRLPALRRSRPTAALWFSKICNSLSLAMATAFGFRLMPAWCRLRPSLSMSVKGRARACIFDSLAKPWQASLCSGSPSSSTVINSRGLSPPMPRGLKFSSALHKIGTRRLLTGSGGIEI